MLPETWSTKIAFLALEFMVANDGFVEKAISITTKTITQSDLKYFFKFLHILSFKIKNILPNLLFIIANFGSKSKVALKICVELV